MNTRISLATVCIALLLIGAAAPSARSQTALGGIFSNGAQPVYRTNKNGSKGRPFALPRTSAYTPLSKQECEGLGGRVTININCVSTYVCLTVDRHGVVRSLCLTQ